MTWTQPPVRGAVRFGLAAASLAALAACSGADGPADDAAVDRAPAQDDASPAFASAPSAPLVELLSAGHVVFGVFSGPKTREQGAAMGRDRAPDFVFYSLESGPFDLPTMADYMAGVADGAGADPPHPLVLRVPPVRDGAAQARENVARALEAGVAGIVFPHVESPEDAAAAVSAMGESSLNMLIVEDKAGVERATEIAGTAGAGVIFAGPGDLRRAYEGDMAAVEDAIQTVLNACKEHDVPCGITAGPEDIEERIAQGFRVFIVSDPAAVTAGRSAAERS